MKKIIIPVVLVFVAFYSNAQLVYENTGLRLNGARYSNYTATWNGGAHAWVYNKGSYASNPNVFRVIMDTYASSGTQLSSNRGAIYFYDDEKPSTTAYNVVYAKCYYTSSDLALKTNIAPLRSATQTVLALRPVTYQWREQEGNPSTKLKSLGFIAQEIERVLPDVVNTDHVGNKMVDYMAIIPVLTGAIQELNARVEELERQLKTK